MRNVARTLDQPSGRLLGGLLVVCLTLAAVPALAHCCADRCHDAEPVAAEADHCDCALSGVEPPADALLLVPDTVADLLVVDSRPAPADQTPSRPRAVPDEAAPHPVPDRTTVLLI